MPSIENSNKFHLVPENEKADFIDRLNKVRWRPWVNRPYSVLMATNCWAGVVEECFARNGFPGLGVENDLYLFPDIWIDSDFIAEGKKYFSNYFKTKKMSDVSAEIEKTHHDNIVELKSIMTDQRTDMIERVRRFNILAANYAPALWINPVLEEYFTEISEQEIPKYFHGDLHKFLGDISIPRKKNAYVLMQEALNSGVDLVSVQEKYGWIKSRDGFTDFYTIEELEEIKKNYQAPHETNVEIPEELKDLAEELRELTFFRTARTDNFYEFYGLARPFFKEMADFIGVSFQELGSYDALSIAEGKPYRVSGHFDYASIGNQYIVSEEISVPSLESIKSRKIEGKVAFGGKVRGLAKIVTHPTMVDKVEAGDILITQMTFPSFISAMQKAAAFVTDEGGITCHAAIIAREMKKPCIVGTKNATKILKDGDLIEVDADNGTVRIIENK